MANGHLDELQNAEIVNTSKFILGNKFYYRSGCYRQVSLYNIIGFIDLLPPFPSLVNIGSGNGLVLSQIHYLTQRWHRSMSPYRMTRPQWVKFSLWTLSPSDVIDLGQQWFRWWPVAGQHQAITCLCHCAIIYFVYPTWSNLDLPARGPFLKWLKWGSCLQLYILYIFFYLLAFFYHLLICLLLSFTYMSLPLHWSYRYSLWAINIIWFFFKFFLMNTVTWWRHRSGSTLAQVMACSRTAPSHYMKQCWPTFKKTMFKMVHLLYFLVFLYHLLPYLCHYTGITAIFKPLI